MKPSHAVIDQANTNAQAPLIGLAVLAKMAFLGKDLSPLASQLLERLAEDPSDANALMDMSIILHLKGNRELGLAMQNEALVTQQIYRLGPDLQVAGTRLLALVCPGDLTENNAVEFLVEGSDIVLEMLYVGPGIPLPETLPDHDVIIVAVSESDRNRPLLKYIKGLVQLWSRPLLNLPDRIGRLSREGACLLLTSGAGIVMPVTARIDRHTLQKVGQGHIALSRFIHDGDFPIIVRPVDSHKGMGLKKLERPLDVLEYLSTQMEDDFYLSRFVDYRSQDGLFRKYRIVFIEGKPYVCHMAISQNWMVHYLSAGMTGSVEKRIEEAHFMETFDDKFALKHQQALCSIPEKLGLEYVGIDCGETPEGDLLIFEVDSSMTIHAMDPIEDFPYKHTQLRKVFNAFRTLLQHTKERGLLQSNTQNKPNENVSLDIATS